MRRMGRLPALGVLVLGVVLGASCDGRGMKNGVPDPCCGQTTSIPQSAQRELDLLLVLDNSGDGVMARPNFLFNFPALMTSLRNMRGGLPNVHVGVTTTDLGVGIHDITYCEEQGGDGGALITGNCTNPTGGQPYIIDVAPAGCTIEMQADNACTAHDCALSNCAHEPSTTLAVDPLTGCPRCRNYDGESLENVVSCVADVGTQGCGFEQPLEALYKALDPGNAANTGFVREHAFLAVLIITTEDDCSAANDQLFDPSQTTLDSTLGPLTAYRCFEFGVTCDINDRSHEGTRDGCVPNSQDPGNLMYPVSRYIERLQALKDPQMTVLAALAGPVTPSPTGIGYTVTVEHDEHDNPELQPSCFAPTQGAMPGIRIFSVLEAFNDVEDLATWAYTPVCSSDFTPALAGIGNKIKDRMEYRCLPSPLRGCADPGVEFAAPQVDQSCAINAQCLATCEVTDVFSRGTPEELRHDVPPCLVVMPDGTRLLNNSDRFMAYANGHPDERDPALPVEACWHIRYQPDCHASNYAELVISRHEDPPPRSFAQVACLQLPSEENLCDDGEDNDENCLVDLDDPGCQP